MTYGYLRIGALLTIITSLPVSAQPTGLAVGVTLTPAFATTRYEPQTLYPVSNGQVVEPVFLFDRRSGFGGQTGVSAAYTFEPRWGFGTGIWYQQHAFSQLRPHDVGSGNTVVRFRSVRVPLLLHFNPNSQQRLSLLFSAGFVSDLLLPTRLKVQQDDKTLQRLAVKQSLNPVFSVLAAAGFRYHFDPHYSIDVQPSITYGLGRFGASRIFSPTLEAGLMMHAYYAFRAGKFHRPSFRLRRR